jgi:hypothetical protein
MAHQERRSLLLWPHEWEALEGLAQEYETVPPCGPTAGQPSWRSLVKEIARGNLVIVGPYEESEPQDDWATWM